MGSVTRRLRDLLAVRWRGGASPVLMDSAVRRPCRAVGGEEAYGCERQEDCDGGVRTHRNFGGAERQSIYYTNGLAEVRVSDQVGSVYLSINRCGKNLNRLINANLRQL